MDPVHLRLYIHSFRLLGRLWLGPSDWVVSLVHWGHLVHCYWGAHHMAYIVDIPDQGHGLWCSLIESVHSLFEYDQ